MSVVGYENHFTDKILNERLLKSWGALIGEIAVKIYECQVDKEEDKRETWDNLRQRSSSFPWSLLIKRMIRLTVIPFSKLVFHLLLRWTTDACLYFEQYIVIIRAFLKSLTFKSAWFSSLLFIYGFLGLKASCELHCDFNRFGILDLLPFGCLG